jgi:phage-related protein
MHAVYYRASDGSEPVRDYLDALDSVTRATLDLQIDRLNMVREEDPPLPYPHSSQIDGELRELRCHHGRALYRVLYRRSGSLFVLLHMSRKSAPRLPASDIDLAQERWQDFQARMNEKSRRPPRAAGHDAP